MLKVSPILATYRSTKRLERIPGQGEFSFEEKKKDRKSNGSLKDLTVNELQVLLAEMEKNLGLPQTFKKTEEPKEVKPKVDIIV